MDTLNTTAFLLIAICGLAGVVSMFRRYRGASGTERQQLKWLAMGGLVFMTLWLLALVIADIAGVVGNDVQNALISVGIAAIPLTAGLAVLRYGLYEIDWIINRTLVYVPLTAILAGIYLAITGFLRTLLTDTTGNSDFIVAMTTVLVVAMLTPVKNYLQEHVDKRFKDRHDPAGVLNRLAQETRAAVEVLDPAQLIRRVLDSTVDALDAGGAAVRISEGPRPQFITCGAWDGRAAFTVPLRYEGYDFGFLSVSARSGGQPFSIEEGEALKRLGEVVAYLAYLDWHRGDAADWLEANRDVVG
jgi:hypothetical protein